MKKLLLGLIIVVGIMYFVSRKFDIIGVGFVARGKQQYRNLSEPYEVSAVGSSNPKVSTLHDKAKVMFPIEDKMPYSDGELHEIDNFCARNGKKECKAPVTNTI
jgi:hypothetical protein